MQLLGNKPCDNFPTMATSEFADKFMASIKAPDECRRVYIKNLALLVCSRCMTAVVANYFKYFFPRGSSVGSVAGPGTILSRSSVNGWTIVLLWAVLVGRSGRP